MRRNVVSWTWILTIVVTVAVLGACRTPTPTVSPLPSPLNTPSSFISPLTPPEVRQGPVFTIDQPVLAGETKIAGSGPAGVPIILIDVTEGGRQLATVTIGEDGRFVFRLSEGLPNGHSVGLQVGELTGTPFKYEDFLYSDTYYDRPLIGILLDMASVVEQ